jgi:hypothetical protein
MKKPQGENEVASVIGKQFAITIERRQAGDSHLCFQLWTEDDENWSRVDMFSSAWVDDLIDVLQTSKQWCEKHAKPDKIGRKVFGWRK